MPQVTFPATFDLANLNGLNGFVLNGQQANDGCGSSVSTAGDVNNDGIADLVIGAPYANSNAGRTYVVFGKSGLGGSRTLNLASLDGANGFVLNGQANDWSGYSVSAAGDVNGDGIQDLLIGAPSSEYVYLAGRTYVVFGKSNLGSNGIINLGTLDGTDGFILNGETNVGRSGWSVSAAGDVNGDGVEDVIIGCNSLDNKIHSYVMFGKPTLGNGGMLNLGALNGTNGFVLKGQASGSNLAVSTAGDINNDGISDILIGARYVPGFFSGHSYVVFGKPELGSNGTLSLDSLDGTNGFVLNGQANDLSGYSVSAAGDVNGDGVDDLLIGAPGISDVTPGRSYVVFGSSNLGSDGVLNLDTLDGINGFVMNGQYGDMSGYSVNSAGDVNGDGISDLLVGAPQPTSQNPGHTYVVLGKPTIGGNGVLDLDILNGTNGFVLNGENADDCSGWSVSTAGDINADGIADILIGAPGGGFAVTPSRSYVVFGDMGSVTLLQNQLTIAQGQTRILDSTNLNATSTRWSNDVLNFQVSNLNTLLGHFALQSTPYTSITIFSQNQITQGQIIFVYTGNYPQVPTYDITVMTPGLVVSEPSQAKVTVLGSLPRNDMSATIIGGAIGGVLGVTALLSASALYFRSTAKHELGQAIAGNGSESAQRSEFRKNVFSPIAKKIYEQIKISGFLGHLGKQTAERFVAAIQALVEELQKQNVDLDLEKMSPENQQQLFKEIVKQIRAHTIPKSASCSRFFKAEVTPVQIEDKAQAIAIAVHAEIEAAATKAKILSQGTVAREASAVQLEVNSSAPRVVMQ